MRGSRDQALDGLRGLAASAVILSHVAAMTWVPFVDGQKAAGWQRLLWHLGAPAVDLFFVLSGFVVAESLLRRNTSYGRHLLGRYARLLPVAWLGIALGFAARPLAATMPAGASDVFDEMRRNLSPADLLGLATMTWPLPDTTLINPPLWSLVVEIQAGFLIPVFAILRRQGDLMHLAAVLGLAVLGFMATGYTYLVSFFGFALGAAIPAIERAAGNRPANNMLLIAGLGLLLARHVAGDGWYLRPVCSVGAAMVIVAVRRGAIAKELLAPVPQWLGRNSYALYALHYPVMMAGVWAWGATLGITPAAVAAIPIALLLAGWATAAIDEPATSWSQAIRNGGGR